jgi:hypothetical protein
MSLHGIWGTILWGPAMEGGSSVWVRRRVALRFCERRREGKKGGLPVLPTNSTEASAISSEGPPCAQCVSVRLHCMHTHWFYRFMVRDPEETRRHVTCMERVRYRAKTTLLCGKIGCNCIGKEFDLK